MVDKYFEIRENNTNRRVRVVLSMIRIKIKIKQNETKIEEAIAVFSKLHVQLHLLSMFPEEKILTVKPFIFMKTEQQKAKPLF